MKKYYLTTPIYYPSDNLHIGHTYTTVAADSLKRFKKELGYDSFFVTGTDEHGQKIQEKAKENNMGPKEYVDMIVKSTKDLWKLLEIDYDVFIRTTDKNHKKIVQDIFMKLYEKGEIYKSKYEGHYCTPCESFWSESQLIDGNCPDCNRQVQWADEEAYFFKLSKYGDRLLKLYEDNPDFIQPQSRKNEMISFIKNGLEDLSVSRSSFDWGIKVPFDENHIIYVWIDALTCYISALGYGSDDDKNFKKYWPANVHLVGKEIVRFHTIIWPALLMALDIELPEKIFGHGWILFDEDKMSKSKGNVVYPEPLIELYGVDSFKYYLLRDFSFGQDGSFTKEKFVQRLNSDLSNDLGNLLRRTVTMIEKYNEGLILGPNKPGDFDEDLKEIAISGRDKVEKFMDSLNFTQALEEIWKIIRRTNKYIDETGPWKEEDQERLNTILYNLAESLRITAVLIRPFMGKTSKAIFKQLGLKSKDFKWEDSKVWGKIQVNTKVERGHVLFPRLDVDKEVKRIEEENQKLIDKRTNKGENEVEENLITIDDFLKVQFKVGEIISCQDHPKADKLLVLEIKIGQETRQIVSGIKEFYKPQDLIGKKVIVNTNLKPVKLRGVESNGMVLAAEKDGKLTLLSTLEDIDSGATIS